MAKKLSTMIFGVTAYTIGVTGLLAIILSVAGLVGIGQLHDFGFTGGVNLFINFLLLSLFGVQHTIMARPKFKEKWMYRYSRHPIMLGAFVGFWLTPNMDMSQFYFSFLFTVYMFIGIQIEERDLVKTFGNKYIQYRNRVGLFFTFS